MTSRKEIFRNSYRWEIQLHDGTIKDENSLRCPEGEIKRISLIPQRFGLLRHDLINIPKEAKCFFYFTCKEELGGNFLSMVFHIGYEHNGKTIKKSIEVK